MKHVEKFIRHLQSSIEKRKSFIHATTSRLQYQKAIAKEYYDDGDSYMYRVQMNSVVPHVKEKLKELHTIQKTETEMLKWLENIRSCHEEMICAMYGNDTNLFDFTLEESQHD